MTPEGVHRPCTKHWAQGTQHRIWAPGHRAWGVLVGEALVGVGVHRSVPEEAGDKEGNRTELPWRLMEESEDHTDFWVNSEALEMLAEMLFDQKSCVTNPQSTMNELLFVASRNQGLWAIST